MASTRLAEAVGYPGSSVAFAQLLSGMERDRLIVREIRGKRTYRIALPEGGAAGSVAVPGAGYPSVPGTTLTGTGLAGTGLASTGLAGMAPASGRLPAAVPGGSASAQTGFDYDELARRLLVHVVRRLAATSLPDAVEDVATVDVPGALTEGADTDPRDIDHRDDPRDTDPGDTERAALQQTVADLERELATAWSRHGTLTAENARLREQLNQTQRDLARERTRRARITSELNQAEVVLLERLLSPAPEDGEKHPDAAAN